MDLSKFVAVSGTGAIYLFINSRSNGLVLEDTDTKKIKFYPSRRYQFTPLESISIYTQIGTEALSEVFTKIKEKEAEIPMPAVKSPENELRDWFAQILPGYDPFKVYPGDIKKVIKWYTFLNDRKLLEETSSSDEEE